MNGHERLTRIVIGAVLLATATVLLPARVSQAGIETMVPPTVITLPSGGIDKSSVTLADLNHDGKLEMLVGSAADVDGQYRGNGRISAVSSSGQVLWSVVARGAADNFNPAVERQPPINSAVSVMRDTDGDGWDEVVVGLGGLPLPLNQSNWHGGVAAFSGRTGQRLWIFYSDDWLDHVHNGFMDGVYATPAVGDVEGDGRQEIVFGSWDQCIYMLDDHGNPLWTNTNHPTADPYCKGNHGQYNEDTVWSSPALADLNGDGKMEVIIGADITHGNINHDPDGGYLYVFSHDGQVLSQVWLDQTIWSSPAVGDIDNDGQPEIVVGTGSGFPGKGFYVTAWDFVPGQGLAMKWQRATVGQVVASPALADLNGDGVPDVIAMSYNGEERNGQCASRSSQVYAWRGSDSAALAGFPAVPQAISGAYPQCIVASPIVADVTGSGRPNILFGLGGEVTILNSDGSQVTDNQYHGNRPTFWAGNLIVSSPAVGDIDGDGKLEIVAGSYVAGNPPKGALYIWKTAGQASDKLPWPMFHHDSRHTGTLVPQPDVTSPTNPTSLNAVPSPRKWSNSSTIQLAWSGAGDAESGIGCYYYSCDTAPSGVPGPNNSWTPGTINSVTTGALPDGQNWYCHVRAVDAAGNWAAGAAHVGPFLVDTVAPVSLVRAPRFVVTGQDMITWSGSDKGSGITGYWIDRKTDNGAWTAWKGNVGAGSSVNSGSPGSTYYFRSRAQDVAGNTEGDHATFDAALTVARYSATANVMNSREEPVFGAQLYGSPVLVGSDPSDRYGKAAIYYDETGSRQLAAVSAQFGALPLRTVALASTGTSVSFYLPPIDNVIVGGSFEGTLASAWEHTGSVTIVNSGAYAGVGALQLSGQAVIKQTQFVARTMRRPTLSLMYMAQAEGVTVTVHCGTAVVPTSLAPQPAWSHVSVPLDVCGGLSTAVEFANNGRSAVQLDEVCLGSAEPGRYTSQLPLVRGATP